MGGLFGLIDNPLMMLILGAIAVMLFGERLPEVARSVGKQLMEVKNGMRGIRQEIENAVQSATTTDIQDKAPQYSEAEHREEATAPKFEPPESP
jgi:sec-independent protein translocase protein TatA